jgi:hypothetical protein
MARSSPQTRLRFSSRQWNQARRGGNLPLAASENAGSAIRSAEYLGIPPQYRINAESMRIGGLAGNSEEPALNPGAQFCKKALEHLPGAAKEIGN